MLKYVCIMDLFDFVFLIIFLFIDSVAGSTHLSIYKTWLWKKVKLKFRPVVKSKLQSNLATNNKIDLLST